MAEESGTATAVADSMDQREAAYEREMGNKEFKNKSYDQAIIRYTRGITLDPREPMLYGNRAMAFIKVGRFIEAYEDCSRALALDETYVKAFFRRGTALKRLKRYKQAADDFRRCVELEPQNQEARKELDELSKMRAEERENPRAVFPVEKPTQDALEQAMTHVKVTDVLQPAPPPVNAPEIVRKEVEIDVSSLPIPQTSYQLFTQWRSLPKNRPETADYILKLPLDKYPSLFDDFLDADMMTEVLASLRSRSDDATKIDAIIASLRALSKLKRFEMTRLFFSEDDRRNVSDIVDRASCSGHFEQQDLDELKKAF